MSGGSLDYIYIRIAELAEMIDAEATRSLHRAFAAKLKSCAEAARILEKVWSGDMAPGAEDGPIRAALRSVDDRSHAPATEKGQTT